MMAVYCVVVKTSCQRLSDPFAGKIKTVDTEQKAHDWIVFAYVPEVHDQLEPIVTS